MNEKQLPNEKRNIETLTELGTLKKVGMGYETDRHSGITQSIASLNIAESLQLLQLEMTETSTKNRESLEKEVDKLIKSNEETSAINKEAVRWSKGLTIALIVVTLIVGLLQAYVISRTAQEGYINATQKSK